MNDLQTQPQMPSTASSGAGDLTIELAKMLALVAPSSMTAEQQEMWLRAAVDSLVDIRSDEVAAISHQVRRSVTRHNQIVPEISKLVAEKRASASKLSGPRMAPLPEPPARPVAKPLTEQEIANLPKWLKDMGLRVGFLKSKDGQLVDAAA